MGTGVLSDGVKQPEHEDGHSPPSSAEVMNTCSFVSIPHMSSWCSTWLSTGTILPLTFHFVIKV